MFGVAVAEIRLCGRSVLLLCLSRYTLTQIERIVLYVLSILSQ